MLGGSGSECQGKLMQISWTIQPGQRLTTGPEQNFACEEATNHVKPKGWRMIGHNASEGIEPRNFHRRIGPRVTFPGSQQRGARYGECVAACRGLSPWQVIQRFASGLGRAMPLPKGSLQQAEEARRRCGGMAVGPTHSRGVAGVMSGEDNGVHSKGLAAERKGSRKRVSDTEPSNTRRPPPYNGTERAASSASSVEEPDVGNPQVRFREGR